MDSESNCENEGATPLNMFDFTKGRTEDIPHVSEVYMKPVRQVNSSIKLIITYNMIRLRYQ